MEPNLQNLQLPVSIWKIILTCYHRNKGEEENMYGIIDPELLKEEITLMCTK